ncbi:MAG TPA: hypothetical protein VFX58_00055 [Chitinophagaceae bacterium]|nr:hypothetical protein [Chitinophagaceae bacterium]
MAENKFTAEQSLQLIGNMINQAKGRFSENGHLYLLWGWAVLVCSLAHFILMYYVKFEQHYIVWLAMWGVFVYQLVYLRKSKKKEKVKTYTDEIMAAVWITFVVLMLLFGFLFGRLLGEEYYRFINPGFLALYGMPTVISGTILRFRPLILGGIFCWLLALVSTVTAYPYQLLLLGAAVIAAWIIPGYLLRNRYKNSN